MPIVEGTPLFGLFQGKYDVLRTARTSVSLAANLIYGNTLESDSESFTTFGGGVLVDQHLGKVSLHGGLTVNGAFGQQSYDRDSVELASGVVLMADAGLTARLSETFKIIGEFKVPVLIDTTDSEINADTSLFTYGVRFHGPGLAADLGFARPLAVDLDGLLMGLPYVAFTARF